MHDAQLVGHGLLHELAPQKPSAHAWHWPAVRAALGFNTHDDNVVIVVIGAHLFACTQH